MAATQVPDRQTAGTSRRQVIRSSVAALAAAVGPTALPGRAGADGSVPSSPVPPAPAGSGVPPEYTADPTDWPVQNGDTDNTRCAADTAIAAATVGPLAVAWSVPLPFSGPWGAMTASPIVVGDTVYMIDMIATVSALDRATGGLRWQRAFGVPTIGPNGLTVAWGRLFTVLGDTAEVLALDPATGADIWRVRLSNNPAEGIDVAPIAHDGMVYVSTVPGNSVAFYTGGGRGIVYALDAASGGTIWQWDTTTDDLWGNGRVNSGGGIWNPPAVGADGTLYLGIANAAPYPGNADFPNASSRPGANLYTNCVVALDAMDVRVRWYDSLRPRDRFDLDSQCSPILTTVEIGGEPRQIVIGSGKHGYVAAIDAASGVEIWKIPIGTHQNDLVEEIPEGERLTVYPGSQGGVLTCMAYRDGVVFVPTLNLANIYSSTKTFSTPGGFNDASSLLVAIDATSGRIRWQVGIPTALTGHATVAGDLVFTGGLDGVLRAYHVADGRPVWRFQLGAGLNAPIAVAGDTLFVAAGGAFVPGPDTVAETVPTAAVLALRLPGQ